MISQVSLVQEWLRARLCKPDTFTFLTGHMVYTLKAIGKEVLADALGATSAMDQRVQFIADWLSGDYFKIELCTAYGSAVPPPTNGSDAIKKIESKGLRNSRGLHTVIRTLPMKRSESKLFRGT